MKIRRWETNTSPVIMDFCIVRVRVFLFQAAFYACIMYVLGICKYYVCIKYYACIMYVLCKYYACIM